MITRMRMFVTLCVLALAAVSGVANATNYTLWVNGRHGTGVVGDYTSFNYWGPSNVPAGVNKKAVNWDGYNSIATQNWHVRAALDCFCTGGNWCYLVTYSASDLMLGYTLANYGGSKRMVKRAVPNSSGVCSNSTGRAQTGWNIKWVRVGAGAAGGTELADAGSWTTSEPLVADMKTATARAMYDHNNTRNLWFYMYAGAKGAYYSFLLPGQDDSVVPYHSSGGVSGSSGAAFCNPSDWWCNDLTLGTAVNEGGRPKWSYHSVAFRDDDEDYDHYTNANWQGIVSVVRSAVVDSAY